MHAQIDPATVERGSSLLLVGPTTADVSRAVHRAIAARDGAVVLVTTDDPVGALDRLTGEGVSRDAIGLVDASGERAVTSGVAEASCVDGPGALTDVGVETSDHLDRLCTRHDSAVLGLDSVSALLAERDVPAVFRFLHVLIGRVRSADGTVVAGIDRSRDDRETVSTVAELFDDVVDVRGAER